ncbi:MAG: hypothetical protein WAV68_00110 [Candidatus Nanogingivalis sp.]
MATKKTEIKEKKAKKKIFKSPSAFAVLFVIIALMAGLTWLIPSGRYIDGKYVQTEKTLKVVEKVSNPKTEITVDEADAMGSSVEVGDTVELRQGFWSAIMSPIKGMKERLDVIVFVLILGGFLGVVMKTQALDAAIGGLIVKMKGREKWLIPILMTLFAIGGTTYGMQEEAVAFYALVIPLMLAAGYNTMTSVMMIVLGAGSGVLASTINPFSTGAAIDAAGKNQVNFGVVIAAQGVILVATLIASIIFTMRYAAKVKEGKYKEDTEKASKIKSLDLEAVPEFTLERKFVVGLFAVTFLVMIISLIPWGSFVPEGQTTIFQDFHAWLTDLPVVSTIFGFGHALPFGDWYFNEISALFLISTILVVVIYYEKFKEEEKSPIDIFLAGVGDLLSVALIIAVAAAIGVVMKSGGIQDTIVFWGESWLRGTNPGIVGVIAYVFYLPLSIIIPSSSGLAAASMPIIAPVVGGIAGREVAIVAFATASGLLNMMAPTIASLMAGLSIAGVSYKAWVKRTAPIMVVFALISLAVIFTMGIL